MPTDTAPCFRRLPVGAEAQPGGDVHFRVWAPRPPRVEVLLEPGADSARIAALAPAEGARR